MVRILILIMSAFTMPAIANTVMDSLSHFNPGSVFKNYTPNPKEASINPGSGNDVLKSRGLNEISQNKKAAELYNHIIKRAKIKDNPDSAEMKKASQLIEQAEKVINGGCYKVAGTCSQTTSKKTCTDEIGFEQKKCEKQRVVRILSSQKTITRRLSQYGPNPVFNLGQCGQFDRQCSNKSLMSVSDTCEAISLRAYLNGYEVQVLSQPTCKNLSVKLAGYYQWYQEITFKVIEKYAKDSISTNGCNLNDGKKQCFLLNTQCIEPNKTKLINGIRINRDCWGERNTYQCTYVSQSDCGILLEEGCRHVTSKCLSQDNQVCTRFMQTFSCMKETCSRQSEIYIDKIPGSDKSIDHTKKETSDDFGEGVSKLGALVGVADDVYKHQVYNGQPQVFQGDAKECKKHPIGIRDCCTDGGWGEWVVHCPKDLQNLLKARKEGRVVSLGSYKKKKWRSRHYVYCVFPSKLAGIIQIQGRGAQLGISFGTATYPNCQGLTPEQLERINFSNLNLASLEAEFKSKKQLPDDNASRQSNQNRIDALYQKGRAHD